MPKTVESDTIWFCNTLFFYYILITISLKRFKPLSKTKSNENKICESRQCGENIMISGMGTQFEQSVSIWYRNWQKLAQNWGQTCFSTTRPWSSSRNVRPFVCTSVIFPRHLVVPQITWSDTGLSLVNPQANLTCYTKWTLLCM